MLEDTMGKLIKGFSSIESVHLNVKHKETDSVLDLKGSSDSFAIDIYDEKFSNMDFELSVDMKKDLELPDPKTTKMLNTMHEKLYDISVQLNDADNRDEIIELLMMYAEYHNDPATLKTIINRLKDLSEKDKDHFSDVINMIDPE